MESKDRHRRGLPKQRKTKAPDTIVKTALVQQVARGRGVCLLNTGKERALEMGQRLQL